MTRETPPVTGPLTSVNVLARALMARTGMTLDAATTAVTGLTGIIADTVTAGHTVKIPGFGTWTAQWAEARTARDPRTGDPIPVPARTTLKHSVSPAFRTRVQTANALADTTGDDQ